MTPTRRSFLKVGSVAVAAAALSPVLRPAAAPAAGKRALKKGIMYETIRIKGTVRERFQAVKDAGFDGVEIMSHMNQDDVLRARDETGLEIPSVCGAQHWSKPLSDPDPKVRAAGLEALKQTLRDARRYGAGSVLLVPGVVNAKVSHEVCWQRSIEQIRQAIPLAAELGVKISIENVWNDFLTQETEAVRYLDEIGSPWVGWHFDCGNIIHYGDPIAWIKALNKRINQVHLKEYSRDLAMRQGDKWAGFRAAFLEGANNWSGIMKALDAIGYTGWGITEQDAPEGPAGLRDLAQRVDRIYAS
jgi:hexulose-6-phosphate isomerase